MRRQGNLITFREGIFMDFPHHRCRFQALHLGLVKVKDEQEKVLRV